MLSRIIYQLYVSDPNVLTRGVSVAFRLCIGLYLYDNFFVGFRLGRRSCSARQMLDINTSMSMQL